MLCLAVQNLEWLHLSTWVFDEPGRRCFIAFLWVWLKGPGHTHRRPFLVIKFLDRVRYFRAGFARSKHLRVLFYSSKLEGWRVFEISSNFFSTRGSMNLLVKLWFEPKKAKVTSVLTNLTTFFRWRDDLGVLACAKRWRRHVLTFAASPSWLQLDRTDFGCLTEKTSWRLWNGMLGAAGGLWPETPCVFYNWCVLLLGATKKDRIHNVDYYDLRTFIYFNFKYINQ